MRILTNHLGYDLAGEKKAILQQSSSTLRPPSAAGVESGSLLFEVRDALSGSVRVSGACQYRGSVDRWRAGSFWEMDFSELSSPGSYRIEVYVGSAAGGEESREPQEPVARSELFEVGEDLLFRETFSNALYWLKGQRCSGAEERTDAGASFFGDRQGTVDLRGGWFDASGDTSKYLSHLSYANHLNPQQTPGVVWTMLAARDLLSSVAPEAPALWDRRLRDEIAWGADFLLRMQDPEGYFYLTLFDQWSKDLESRMVSTFRTQNGYRGEDYQAGYRQGGGVTIAALARAGALGLAAEQSPGAMSPGPLPGEFTPMEYLQGAARGFEHLEEHNLEYLDDGQENIIDDYTALLAASELFLAPGGEGWPTQRFLAAARRRAESLQARLLSDEEGLLFWKAGEGERPYYHAAEAGLPVIALLRYAACEHSAGDTSRQQGALEVARRAIEAELSVTENVVNPFGYARQHVAEPAGPKRTAFFIPHVNESGYWWQGENARIASLSAAALLCAAEDRPETESASGGDSPGRTDRELLRYATDQLNWILGLNPFDICMLDGVGRNNPEYELSFPNAPGGICNGITGGVEDEGDIAFLPEPWGRDPLHRWRWSEQWIPHVGWYLLAVSALRSYRY